MSIVYTYLWLFVHCVCMYYIINYSLIYHYFCNFRVMQLQQEIEKVKEAQQAGFGRGSAADDVQLNLAGLAALDAADLSSNGKCAHDMIKLVHFLLDFEGAGNKGKCCCALVIFLTCWSNKYLHIQTNINNKTMNTNNTADAGGSWTPGTSGIAITGSQQVQLQQIKDRDAEFDQDLDEIGDGIQDLHELALRQGEEVKRQNEMLSKTESALDAATEHMVNVNSKMKETLNEVGRSSDKLCVDIMCIVSSRCLLYNVYLCACLLKRFESCLPFTDVGSWLRWYILQNVYWRMANVRPADTSEISFNPGIFVGLFNLHPMKGTILQ